MGTRPRSVTATAASATEWTVNQRPTSVLSAIEERRYPAHELGCACGRALATLMEAMLFRGSLPGRTELTTTRRGTSFCLRLLKKFPTVHANRIGTQAKPPRRTFAVKLMELSVLSGRWGADSFTRPRRPWLGRRSLAISATERGRYNISLQLSPKVRLWFVWRPEPIGRRAPPCSDAAGQLNSALGAPILVRARCKVV